jgi:putative transposase
MGVQPRKIIGLSMKDQLSEDPAAAALKQAVMREKSPEGLIHHSDRGRQYASYGYQGLSKLKHAEQGVQRHPRWNDWS